MAKTYSMTHVLAVLLAALLALGLLPFRAEAASEYTAAGATQFVFSDSGITVTEGNYSGYKTDATDLTINSAGTYVVSGSCADGSITVKKGTTGVTLVLNGLTLTSSDTAPIACSKSTEVTIVAASGTINMLTDSAKNNDETYPDNTAAENAVIKCKDGSTVTLCGSGTLKVAANGKNGIKSGATTETEGEASLTICDLTLNITAGVNDAINAEQLLNIKSGILNITAADDAIHCDYVMNIGATGTAGPVINITKCCEGIEAAELNVYSGDININSTDDCMNAANSDLTDYDFVINISGGTINAYASEGDGFDSNGDLNISGGTVVVWTANSADNQPLDADGTLNISGGTVLAAGGSNGMGVPTTATQPYVAFGSTGGMGGGQMGGGRGSTLLSKGSAFYVKDSSGSTVYSGSAVCSASYVFFSTSKLTGGNSYSLYSGSASVFTATAQTGTVSGGFPGGMGGSQHPGGADGQTPPARPDGDSDMIPPDGMTPPNGQQPPAMPDGADGAPPRQNGAFSDVSEGDWFYEGARYVSQNGLMNGTGGGAFSPNTAVTRGMLVTILYRLDGEPSVTASCPFTDVSSGSYYESAVTWAASNGIVSGYGNGRFGPNDAVTREQLAAILYRYAQYKGYDLSGSADLTGFADQAAVGSFARSAMSWANANGFINGSSGELAPKGTATRAQTAVILTRFCQKAV